MPTYTHKTYDGVCAPLLGNGELCTTVGATGYHAPPDGTRDTAHRTQHFVLAARRAPGARHRLLNFGSLSRDLHTEGLRVSDTDWSQVLDVQRGELSSVVRHGRVSETTRSAVTMERNCLLVETTLEAHRRCRVGFDVLLTLPAETYRDGHPTIDTDRIGLPYEAGDHTGVASLASSAGADGAPIVLHTGGIVRLRYGWHLEAGRTVVVRTLLHFSDRTTFGFPVSLSDFDVLWAANTAAWSAFHASSTLEAASADVDDFRAVSLYTLRAQMTPWSIAPTLSEPYWGGGAFHDEMYPYYALMSGNHADLAERIPRFRLLTLPAAMRRGRALGALYPWSSTEDGDERDPEGIWLTERFHLAQVAAHIRAHWLYQRDRRLAQDWYPVMRETARYLEATVLEVGPDGRLGTRPCVDFDESVGAIRNGPFTVSGAASALACAAQTASDLGLEEPRAMDWLRASAALRLCIPASPSGSEGGDVFAIPDGAPLHYSVLGHVFPFRTEVGTDRAIATARWTHETLRSRGGWKPGLSAVYENSNWTWTAGHLGIVHAMHGDADRAWEAVRGGPSGAGPGPTPTEHTDRNGTARVPWFTTGVGAWLYALHALVAWVDECATHLLSGAAAWPQGTAFAGIRGGHGTLVSGHSDANGAATVFVDSADAVEDWRYSVPHAIAASCACAGHVVSRTPVSVVYTHALPRDARTAVIRPGR
jgi:hypothetical protein